MAEDHSAPGDDQRSRWSSALARPDPRRHAVWLVLAGAGLVGYAWVDAAAAPFTTRAFVGVLIPGAVLAAIAWGRPPERIPPPDDLDVLGMSYWVICLAALFEWEASSFRDNSWPWHPSLTNLINPLIATHPVKTAAILVWILAGWALVKR
ncbi:MAG TPA: hypothetical protein VGS19_23375 [Streptosporangiaceae bacterium]|nr:hypothetical protein [Streptosporangiaceae bacterium]